MSGHQTSDDILNLAEGHVTQRIDRFRWDLLNFDEEVIGELTPDLERAPKISNDTTRTIKRSVEGIYLPANEANHIDGIGDKCRPVMILQNDEVFSLGVFLWGDDSHPKREWGEEHSSSLVDKGLILSLPYGKVTGSKKGQDVLTRARQFAQTAFSPDEIEFEPISRTLTAPLTYDPSATLDTIINDHLSLIGYYPVFFDRDGVLTYRPTPADIIDEDPTVPPLDDGGRIERDSIVYTSNLLDAPNEFVVYESSGDSPARVGTYRIDARHPHSVENRGFVVRKVESRQGLANNVAALTAAKALALTDTRKSVFEWVNFTTALDPRHDTFDILEFYGEKYLEVKWSMDMRSGGRMTHEARKIYD